MHGSEPTITLHTRVAMDEIYELMNQPIDQPNRDLDADPQGDGDGESDFFDDDVTTNTDAGGRARTGSDSDSDSGEEEEEEEEGGGDDDDDDDYESDRNLNYEEETVGLTDDTYYQKFNANHADEDEDEDEDEGDADNNPLTEEPDLPPATMQPLSRKLFGDENHSGGGSAGRKRPFMTPIVERTEVSLPPTTARRRAAEKAQAAKTPSRPRGGERERRKGELEKVLSSPFMEIVPGQGGGTTARSGSGPAGSEEDSDFFLPPPRKLGGIKSPPPQSRKAGSPRDKENGDKENSKKAPLGPGHKKPLVPSTPAHIPPKADIAHKGGPLITDTQLNPMTPEIHATILSKLTTPLSAYEGYYEYLPTTKSKAAEIRKGLKPPSAKASGAGGGGKSIEVVFPGKPGAKGRPAMGQTKYIFTSQIGEGAFAPIYQVENTDITASAKKKKEDSGDEMEAHFADLALVTETRHLNRTPTEAIKMETEPPSAWEFYIMRQAHRRLGLTRASESILLAHECHIYPTEASFLILPYLSQGTVLDLVNLSNRDLSQQGKPSAGLDETLAMFLTVEILRTVEGLHAKDLIHGDLKGDNCLVRFLPLDAGEEWEPRYRRDGGGGWNKKGITLIDFGRGVDMKVFPTNVQFVADWPPDKESDCVEICEMRPWSYQIDYHGCAGIIHSLLFGKYLEIVGEKGAGVGVGMGMGGKCWRVKESFKRYWQGDIWTRCFDVLLNPAKFAPEEEGARLPVLKAIKGMREEMEGWLEANSEKGTGLRNVIRRLEGVVRDRR